MLLLSGKCKVGVLEIICTWQKEAAAGSVLLGCGGFCFEGFFPATVYFRIVQLLSQEKQRHYTVSCHRVTFCSSLAEVTFSGGISYYMERKGKNHT